MLGFYHKGIEGSSITSTNQRVICQRATSSQRVKKKRTRGTHRSAVLHTVFSQRGTCSRREGKLQRNRAQLNGCSSALAFAFLRRAFIGVVGSVTVDQIQYIKRLGLEAPVSLLNETPGPAHAFCCPILYEDVQLRKRKQSTVTWCCGWLQYRISLVSLRVHFCQPFSSDSFEHCQKKQICLSFIMQSETLLLVAFVHVWCFWCLSAVWCVSGALYCISNQWVLFRTACISPQLRRAPQT